VELVDGNEDRFRHSILNASEQKEARQTSDLIETFKLIIIAENNR